MKPTAKLSETSFYAKAVSGHTVIVANALYAIVMSKLAQTVYAQT
jgi:hypothetical protein